MMLKKRQSPKVCDYTSPAHRGKRHTAQDTGKPKASKKQKGRDQDNDENARKQNNDQGDEQNDEQDGEQDSLSKEEAIPICGRCNKLSRPPRGKKISWRQSAGSWMFVNKWAREELPPFEEDLVERQTSSRAQCPDLDDDEELPDLDLLLKWANEKRTKAELPVPNMEARHGNKNDIEPHHESDSEIKLLVTPPQSPSGQQAVRGASHIPAQSPLTTPAPKPSQAAEHVMLTPLSINNSSTKRRAPSLPLRSPIKKSRVGVLDLTGDDFDIESEVENSVEGWTDL